MKKRRKILTGIAAAVILIVAAGAVWFGQYYHTTEEGREALSDSADVRVLEIPDGYFFDGSGTKDVVVFYPGAKVEFTAYAPLMHALAEEGIDCMLVKMPLNFALLGKDKAAGLMERYEYQNWFLAGHSLGGVAACQFASEAPERVRGLILLASYPTDTVNEELGLLSVYGTEDEVLNRERYDDAKAYWPSGARESVIPGGNHAQFGAYGPQKGDGTATISDEEQQALTAEAIVEFVMGENEISEGEKAA